MAGDPAARAAALLHGAAPDHESGDRRQRGEPHPLAEPLACGAAVLDVLPERFRRPHRQPRDADRPGDARKPRRAAHRRVVHHRLRHQRAGAAGVGRPVARAAGDAVVLRLYRDADGVRAAHARPLQGRVGGALGAHRPHRRQLHQHPHREAVRPREGRRRLCARGGRLPHRPLPLAAAAQHAVRAVADDAERAADDRHRRVRASCCGSTGTSASARSRWRCR